MAPTLDPSSGEALLRSFREKVSREKLSNRSVEDLNVVRALAAERRFLHWDLEFPEVFYALTGVGLTRVERLSDGEAGFDAVVGNPPYDELSEHAAGRELPEKGFFNEVPLYKPALGGRMNLFRFFIIRTLTLLNHAGRHGFIVPMAILGDTFTEGTRRYMLERGLLREVAAFPQKDDPNTRVFYEAKLSTSVLLCESLPKPDDRVSLAIYPRHVFTDPAKRVQLSLAEIRDLEPEHLAIPSLDPSELARWRALRAAPRITTFGEVAKCWLGDGDGA
jgi:hypothetical protein